MILACARAASPRDAVALRPNTYVLDHAGRTDAGAAASL